MTSTAIAKIRWDRVHGRQAIYRLQPQMLSESGLIKEIEIQPIHGKPRQPRGIYAVVFDRAYAVGKMAYEIEECSELPFLDLVELLLEAYTIVNPTAPIVGVMPAIRNAVKVDRLFQLLGTERNHQELGDIE
jgi:hypothetical protein